MAKSRIPIGSLPRETVNEIDLFAKNVTERFGKKNYILKRPAAIHIAVVEANKQLNRSFTILDPKIENYMKRKKHDKE